MTQDRIDPVLLEAWVEEGWLAPGDLSDLDLARASLIRDLRERLGVNDEGVAVVLDLLDQIHGLRHALRRVTEAVQGLPDPLRQETLTAIRAVVLQVREPPSGP